MIARVTILLLATATLTTAAAQAASKSVIVDGVRVNYTSSLGTDGVIHFHGYDTHRGEELKFRLLPNGWLLGYVGERMVEVRIDRRKRERVLQELSQSLENSQNELASAGN